MPLDVDGLAVEYGTFMGQSTRCIALGASLLPGSVKTEAGENVVAFDLFGYVNIHRHAA